MYSWYDDLLMTYDHLPLEMVYEMVYGDFFGLLFFTVRQTLDWTHLSFRTLNFLPNCSFCKQLKKRLRRCVKCKSVKHCDKVCQSNDWNHHQKICKRNSRGIWLLETFHFCDYWWICLKLPLPFGPTNVITHFCLLT